MAFIAVLMILAQLYINSIPLNAPPIRSDGHGYYMYLPAFFIYHDPRMTFLDEIDDVGSFSTTYFQSNTGAMVDKYTMGTALLQLPFFLVAHLITLLLNPIGATGFTEYYQIANGVSAAIWYFIGAVFAYKTVCKYIPKKFALLAVIVCTFGSNLFHYATYDASFSHVYSFAMISIFIYWIHMEKTFYTESKCSKRLFYLLGGVIYGLIILIRVTDATVILLYCLFNITGVKDLKNRIKDIASSKIVFFGIGAIIAFLPQMMYWKITTGKFLMNSYGVTDAGFKYLNSPKIIQVLFVPERGIFFWCPVLLVGVILGIIWKDRIKPMFFCSVIFFCVYIYVIASWHSFTLAGGYSHRIFVNIMMLFMLFTGNGLYGISQSTKAVKITVYFIFGITTIWNIICMYAYWRYVIGFDGFQLSDAIKIIKWYTNRQIQ